MKMRILTALLLLYSIAGCVAIDQMVLRANRQVFMIHDGIKDTWQEPIDDAIPLDDFRFVVEPKWDDPSEGYIGFKFTF